MKSWNFVQIVQMASTSALIIQLSKLVDKNGVSLIHATKQLRDYPCMFNKTKDQTIHLVKSVDDALAKNTVLIKNLTEQRNRYHIHLDKSEVIEHSKKSLFEFPLHIDDIDPLLKDLCGCIVNLANHYRDDSEMKFFIRHDEETVKFYLTDIDLILKDLFLDEIFERLKFN